MVHLNAVEQTGGPAPPSRTALVLAALATLLLCASAALQLRASAARWEIFGPTLDPAQLSIESHRYDYYLPGAGYLPIPGTALPFGAGMMLQAAGVLCLLLVLYALRERACRAVLCAQILLGALAAGSFAALGARSISSALRATAGGTPGDSPLFAVLGLLGFAALGALCIMCCFTAPALGLCCVFLLGSTPIGYFLAGYLVAPMLAGYISPFTTPGTETIVALSTAAAAITLLVAVLTMAWQRRK